SPGTRRGPRRSPRASRRASQGNSASQRAAARSKGPGSWSARSAQIAAASASRPAAARALVSYLGLDPRVRQSGEARARHGRISKQGSPEARHMLGEAAWVVVRTPGPPKAFYERLRSRRGSQIALVATARKLCVLFWHPLTRAEDYALQRPS